MILAGIDPGKNGAIVIIDDGEITNQWVMPLKADNSVDLNKLCEIIENLTVVFGVQRIMMEEPGVLFGVGKTSMFVMGRVLGNIESSLTCTGANFEYVRPKAWQKVIWTPKDMVKEEDGKKTMPKATSLNAANRIFPTHTEWFYGDNENNTGRRSKVHDGIVDAALIAHYCKLKHDGRR